MHSKIPLLQGRAGIREQDPHRCGRLLERAGWGYPISVGVTAVTGFSSEAISACAKRHLMPGSQVLSDGLGCFRVVTIAKCHYKVVITSEKNPNDYRFFGLRLQHARRYLGGFCFRLKRRFSMV